MPVIRVPPSVFALGSDRRRKLVEQLANELAGKATPSKPLIYEIPLDQTDQIDVLVVWQEWENIRSEDRSNIILESYQDQQRRIAQALGVTYQEAMEQHLLPYAVVPLVRRGEGDLGEVRRFVLEEGGIALPSGRVDLRFPTMAMAEEVHRRLCKKLPDGYWSIVQMAAPVASFSGV